MKKTSLRETSRLDAAFELQLSTDEVRVFKPSPDAYRMGLDAFHLRRLDVWPEASYPDLKTLPRFVDLM